MPLSPPSVPVFPAGYSPVTSDFTGWVQNSLGFLTQGIVFRAERHASLSLPAGTTTIGFDTIVEDPYSGWNAGSSGWVCPFTGIYEVTLTVVVATASNVVGAVVFTPYSSTSVSSQPTGPDVPGGGSGWCVLPLIAGSVIKGAASVLNSTTTVTTNGQYCTMEISYMGQG